MNFLKELFDSFIPHEKNDYKPHFFRVKAVLAVACIIAVFGLGAIFLQKIIVEEGDFLAAVIASAVVDLTNTDRKESNLAYLSVNPILERAAQLKADDMATKSYFAHTAPDGTTPWHWFKEAGYNFVYAGENLAVRFYDSIDVVRAWMNSPGHRANILNEHFTEIGVGVAEGVFEGTPTVFVVQMFGAPAASWSPFPDVSPVQASKLASAEASGLPQPSPASDVLAVKGASTNEEKDIEEKKTEQVIEPEPVPKVLVQDETFIAVKNEMATNSPVAAAVEPGSSISLVQQLMTSPKSVVETVYIVIAAIVGIALVIMIGIEMRRQYPKNIALGFLLLILMGGLLYLGQILFPGTLTIL